MANIQIPVPGEFQQELKKLLLQTAREAILEAKEQQQRVKPYMEIKEACDYVGVSRGTINVWIRKHGLKVSEIEGKKIIAKQTIDEFIKAHEV